jgi:hypothetical protein
MGVSTALIGLISYLTTVYVFALLPRNLMLEVIILVSGTVSGLIGGYIAAIIWKKYLLKLLARL